ncbi:MAG: hypothetical protein WCT27_04970 [Patescibacteria group bacterium]|jgi:hypothetical protein
MPNEIFLLAGSAMVLLVFYYSLKSKAKFKDENVGRLIFFRSVFGLFYIAFIYFFTFVWRLPPFLYLGLFVGLLIILWIIDYYINKKWKATLSQTKN